LSENSNRIISSNRPRPGQLFAVWLFLVIIPAITLMVAFEMVLKDSESYLTDKVKIRMMQELNDFRGKLSFSSMVELRMRGLSLEVPAHFTAEKLQHEIETKLQIPVTAVFAISPQQRDFSMHMIDDIRPEIGMVSRTMMRNYLLYLAGQNRELTGILQNRNEVVKPISDTALERSILYLRSLFSAAGEISLQNERAVPAFSNKPGLGRLVFFTMPLPASGLAIVIIRESDIKIKQLADFAASSPLFSDLKRSYITSSEGKSAVYRQGRESLNFSHDPGGNLILKSMASEELLLRMSTGGTLYPSNIRETIKNLPLLQVTAPIATLQHPLRTLHAATRTGTLILVVLSSIVLLRIFLFGYGRGLNIRTRLFICVFAASILPFSTFLAGIFYHEHFSEEFAKAEISQNLQLQQDFLNKSLNARIENEERRLAELSEVLGRLDYPGTIEYLKEWQMNSVSAAVLLKYGDQENIFASNPEKTFNQTELSMKNLSFMALADALIPVYKGKEAATHNLGAVGFSIKGLGLILENVGKLHDALSKDIFTIFSSFPVYAENQRFEAPKALLLVKYYTEDILNDFLQNYPDFLKSETRGGYKFETCLIPIKQNSRLPHSRAIIAEPGFAYDNFMQLARKTLRTRSSSSWADDKNTAVASYHNRLHCIIIHTASRISENETMASSTLLPAIIYFLLIVATMVIFMAKILIGPIELLKNGAACVAAGDYQHNIEHASGDEFEHLTSSFNHLTAGLYQRELLASYVSQDVLEEVSSDLALQPGGERVEASVLFCALKGFKEFSTNADPEKIVAAVARLIEVTDQAASRNGGVMDKLIEDTVMLVFRQRSDENDHVFAACRTALEISEAFPSKDVPFRAVTGIASGPAVSGKIGSKTGKLDFTLIGNPVNLAARLKAQAHKAVNTGIITCPATIRLLKGQARLRFIERTEIKGRSRTFPLYELMEMR
jgi:class 3 adenylate cyclase